ncbi:SARP family transcriptional regulator [Embleya hyalina]|uniref:SARP family transcriptional regulator n=1 Tax=Embleya hyalina TaxID=516124 RepID=A0A401Z185_9ACTN|nr:SARP family transcriptional regulator [Embleya hyalina]
MLGPLAVWTEDGASVPIPEAKVRALLADLLIHEGRPVPADRLIEDLWGRRLPRNPVATLQTRVSQLRRALEAAEPGGRDLVVWQPPGYRLAVSPDAVDAGRFRVLVERARSTEDAQTRKTLLTDALALGRGPAYADVADEEFARSVAVRLDKERITAQGEHALARLDLGEQPSPVDEIGDLVTRHPLCERLRAVYLRALYLAGRQSEALAAYAELRERLADELGVDPGPELAALYERILRQDPGLQATAPGSTMVDSRAGAVAAPGGASGSTSVPEPGPGSVSDAGSGPGVGSGSAAVSGPVAFAAAPSPTFGLPVALTPLIGRADAVARVRALMAAERLVTLTGPGGVGKTALAVEVARDLPPPVSDGVPGVEAVGFVDFVDLDPATATPADVVETITRELRTAAGVGGELRALAAALASRRLLLVLDTCEHVVDAVATVAEGLLRAVPGLRILATGREPLAVPGERLWPVPPLPVPAPEAAPEVPMGHAAVELFVERVAATVPGFRADADNAAAVATICRRLDGIPLALELAAGRVRGLGVAEVAARLDDRFAIVASGRRAGPTRHRTLRATLDWSWDLLSPPEQAVLRRLSVAEGGWRLPDAIEVAGAGGGDLDVVDALTRLVDRSLVAMTVEPDGPRYRLAESVRAYGLDRLWEAGELAGRRRVST